MNRAISMVLKPILFTAIFLAAAFHSAQANAPQPGDIVDLAPKASAQMWVSADEQSRFVSDLKAFAKSESLKFNEIDYEAPPWKTIGITLVTSKGNDIKVINAVDSDRFEVFMTVYPENVSEDWNSYWNALEKTVGPRYKWNDQ